MLKQAWIAAKRNFKNRDQSIHQICGYMAEQVMKASIAYKTLDNITVVLLAFKNFKSALQEEFDEVNHLTDKESNIESGQVGGSDMSEDQQRATSKYNVAF